MTFLDDMKLRHILNAEINEDTTQEDKHILMLNINSFKPVVGHHAGQGLEHVTRRKAEEPGLFSPVYSEKAQ